MDIRIQILTQDITKRILEMVLEELVDFVIVSGVGNVRNKDYDRRYSAARRLRLRLAGLCESCGRVRVKRFGKCRECLIRHDKNRRATQRAESERT
jgi:hypothetical protein